MVLDARYRLVAVRRTANDCTVAIAQWLEIKRRDASFRDGVVRNARLFAVFTLLGEQSARVQRARVELQKIAS